MYAYNTYMLCIMSITFCIFIDIWLITVLFKMTMAGIVYHFSHKSFTLYITANHFTNYPTGFFHIWLVVFLCILGILSFPFFSVGTKIKKQIFATCLIYVVQWTSSCHCYCQSEVVFKGSSIMLFGFSLHLTCIILQQQQ